MSNLPFYVYVLGSGWVLAALGVAFCIFHIARHERELAEMRRKALAEPADGRKPAYVPRS